MRGEFRGVRGIPRVPGAFCDFGGGGGNTSGAENVACEPTANVYEGLFLWFILHPFVLTTR